MKPNPGQWKKGQSGNPAGPTKGTVHGLIRLRDIYKPHSEAILKVLISKALEGEMDAIKLCLDRFVPRTKHELITIDIPHKIDSDSVLGLAENCLKQIASGEMTLDDAQAFMQVLESHVKIFQSKDLEAQFNALREKIDSKKEGNIG